MIPWTTQMLKMNQFQTLWKTDQCLDRDKMVDAEVDEKMEFDRDLMVKNEAEKENGRSVTLKRSGRVANSWEVLQKVGSEELFML